MARHRHKARMDQPEVGSRMALGDALERSIEHLSARFPQLSATVVAEAVYTAHAQLRERSVINDHLIPLAHRRAHDTLTELAASAPR